jgi:hypothetical protein
MPTSTQVIEPQWPLAGRKGDPTACHNGERVGNHRPECHFALCHFAQVAVARPGSPHQAGMEGQAIERYRLDKLCSMDVAAGINATIGPLR